MTVASNFSPGTTPVRAHRGIPTSPARGWRLRRACSALTWLLLGAASGCGGRTIDDASSTATDALTTNPDQELDAGAGFTDAKGRTDTTADAVTSGSTPTDRPPTGAPTDSTFKGRCDTSPTAGSVDATSSPESGSFTSTAATTPTSSSATPIGSSGTTEGSTSGNTGGLAANCGVSWCWETPVAAGEIFYSLSRDGKYASAANGVVVAWPGTYLPSAPTSGWGSIEASDDGSVWLGNTEGLFRYDGSEWTHTTTEPVLALSQSPGGATWALFDSEKAPVRRLVDGGWVLESAPAGGIDLIAFDDGTAWLLTGTPARYLRDGLHTGELTLYSLTSRGATVVSNFAETQIATPRFALVGDHVYVHDDGGLTGEVYDPVTWLVRASKPAGAIGLYGTLDGRLLTNVWPNLTTFNERADQVIYGQLCLELVSLDPESMLCTAYEGGLVRLSVPRVR